MHDFLKHLLAKRKVRQIEKVLVANATDQIRSFADLICAAIDAAQTPEVKPLMNEFIDAINNVRETGERLVVALHENDGFNEAVDKNTALCEKLAERWNKIDVLGK